MRNRRRIMFYAHHNLYLGHLLVIIPGLTAGYINNQKSQNKYLGETKGVKMIPCLNLIYY